MTPAQCRAARALINMTQTELAKASDVSEKTITDFEKGARKPYRRTIAALRQVLEAAGVEFIPENGGGEGLRLRRPAG